jgi:hypothetical protein
VTDGAREAEIAAAKEEELRRLKARLAETDTKVSKQAELAQAQSGTAAVMQGEQQLGRDGAEKVPFMALNLFLTSPHLTLTSPLLYHSPTPTRKLSVKQRRRS